MLTITSNRIVEYESRIMRLESLLQERNAAQPHVRQQPLLRDAESSVPLSSWVNSLRHEVEVGPRPRTPEINPFDLDLIVEAADNGFAEDLGELSMGETSQDALILNTIPQLPPDDMLPSVDFQEDAAFLQSAAFEPEAIQNISAMPPPMPAQYDPVWYLPPPELGTSLLAEFLTDFNTAYPLYQPQVIADHLRICYGGLSDGTCVAWTSAYVVFGLAHMLRAMSTTGTSYDTEMAQYYLSRIYLALNALLTAPPSLGQVQCLIGVAMLIMCSPCSYNQSEGHFVSTSLRVIRSLVYEDIESDGSISVTRRDAAQERRVFWIAFIHDTFLSMVKNTPPTHKLEDVTDCSDFIADELGAVTAAEGNWRVHIFWLSTRLALLQTEAMDQVLLLKARNTNPVDIAAATTMILARLQGFYDRNEIFQLPADQLFQLLYRSDITHTVHLQGQYFATVYRLHAFVALGMQSKINPFKLDGLKMMATMKEHKAYQDAKKLLSLLPVAPRGNVGLYW
jgi:hypothetical protein